MQLPSPFPRPSPKNKKLFPKIEFSSSNITKFFWKQNVLVLILINFLIRNLFLYFWKWNLVLFSPSSKNKKNPPQENFQYFRKRKPPPPPPQNCFVFSKMKAFLIFQETETLKSCLYFRR